MPIRRKHLAEASTATLAAALLALAATLLLKENRISAQDFPAVVGRIEGDDFEVVTTTPAGVEKDSGPTVVASGSEVTLRSGHALLMLNNGGEISVCGPARFRLVKSSGAVTLALDYGRVHPSLDTSDAFTIYTPTIVATPISISGGRRDTTVGLDESGEMCMLTARGAMRVEPQFAAQSMIVPQGGTVSLSGGQINSLQADPSACSCDFPRARMERPKPTPAPVPAVNPQPALDIGTLAAPSAPEVRKTPNTPPPSSGASEPVYTVLMPPLTFSAGSPEPPPAPAPETIMLVREVRLRPSVEFRGRVNPAPAPAPALAVPAAPSVPAPAPSEQPTARPQPGLMDRMRNFFRRLTSVNRSSCAGAGCDG